MTFGNPVVGGNKLIRPAIQSPNYVPGVSGWTINRDGTAEFNDVTVRGDIVITGDAESSNYVPGVSGWMLDSSGSAEFNGGGLAVNGGTVSGASVSGGTVTGATVQTAMSGQRVVLSNAPNPGVYFYDGIDPNPGLIESDSSINAKLSMRGDSGFISVGDDSNGVFRAATGITGVNVLALAAAADGRLHTGSAVDTTVSMVGNETAVGSANIANCPQIEDHAYLAVIQVAFAVSNAGNRGRFRLWNGAVGGTQLGSHAPIVRNNAASTNENKLMVFGWRASSSSNISNINLGMEFFSGSGSVTCRIETTSYAAVVVDLGPASRFTNW